MKRFNDLFIFFKVAGVTESSNDILLCCQGTIIPTIITQSFTVTESSNSIKVEICEGFTSNNTEDSRTLLAVVSFCNSFILNWSIVRVIFLNNLFSVYLYAYLHHI